MIHKCHLKVLGRGAVTPRGAGIEFLFEDNEWQTKPLPSLDGKKDGANVFRVEATDPKLSRWQIEPRLRRASPISLFMIEAAQQAIDEAGGVNPKRLGIVAALSTGCIVYSRRFFQDMRREGRRFASPLLFPETVYNAPAGHVAAVLGAQGPCYSLVGDNAAWVSAIATAACWLERGAAEQVLVIGAEELDAILIEAYRAAGWYRSGGKFIPAEGAGALLLAQGDGSRIISALAQGFHYRNAAGARRVSASCFDGFGEMAVYPTANNSWLEPIEAQLLRRRPGVADTRFPYCGDAFSASSAWHSIRALKVAEERSCTLLAPIWGLNEQISALQLGSEKKQ